MFGYLGVDMMICRQEGGREYVVHPCVEINMRMNMGVVARLFYDNYVAPGRMGYFNIEYFPDNETLRVQHERDMKDYPLVIEGGRLVSGYLPLVPVTARVVTGHMPDMILPVIFFLGEWLQPDFRCRNGLWR